MKIVPVLMTFPLVFFLALLAGEILFGKRRRIIARLNRLDAEEEKEEEEVLNRPFRERIIIPALERLGREVTRFTPAQINANLERRLFMAGQPFRQRAAQFVALRGGLALVLPLLTLGLALAAGLPVGRVILWTLLALVAALLLPVGILEVVIRRRQGEIQRSLPAALDLLVVSVEAGLGFDMALAKVTEKLKGTLADEFGYTLNEVRLGRVRRLALRDMAARTGVEEFNNFIGAVIQADQLGVSIGNVLRVQADSMREKRRQRFQEAAAKTPIKMLFPLIFLIFPALFLIILGPAAIQIMKTFAAM